MTLSPFQDARNSRAFLTQISAGHGQGSGNGYQPIAIYNDMRGENHVRGSSRISPFHSCVCLLPRERRVPFRVTEGDLVKLEVVLEINIDEITRATTNVCTKNPLEKLK